MARFRIPKHYSVDVLGNIRERLTSLGGFGAFLHEIVQNAEDSGCSWLEFDMDRDRLEIRNPSVFDEGDWTRITEIAHGGKPAEKIGTFGVGFTSVFQFTDCPTVMSREQAATISLIELAEGKRENITESEVPEHQGTTFRLPWARAESVVRKRLEQPCVTDEALDTFWAQVPSVLRLALLFLTTLERVTFKYGDRTLTVSRKDAPCTHFDGVRRQISLTRSGSEPELEAWLLARTMVEADSMPTLGRDPELAIAMPLVSSAKADGLLFSFLPTQHRTGLPFHIHGRFFAKSDRKGIERDGETDKVSWNAGLLNAVPHFVAELLPGLLAEVGHSELFLCLPCHDYACESFPELDGIVQSVIAAEAGGLLLLLNRHGQPTPSTSLFRAASLPKDLLVLAEECGAHFLDPEHEEHSGWMGVFGIEALDLESLTALPTFASLKPGTKVTAAPAVLQGKDRLALVYRLVERLLVGHPEARVNEVLETLPIAVTNRGHLQPPRCVWAAEAATVALFDPLYANDEFWSPDAWEQVPKGLDEWLPEYGSDDALALIEQLVSQGFPKAFAQQSDRLAALYRHLAGWRSSLTSDKAKRAKLARLPIWQRTDGAFKAASELSLPSAFVDPLGFGFVFGVETLKQDLSEPQLLGVIRLLEDLGVTRLDLTSYCCRYVPEYSKALPARPSQQHSAQLVALLELLRSELRAWQDNSAITAALRPLRIVPSSAGDLASAGDLYWSSEALDIVFGNGKYLVPGHTMAGSVTPTWEELYSVLGIGKVPRVQDIVARIKALAALQYSQARNGSLRTLLEYINERFETFADSELQRINELATVAWLPVADNEEQLGRPTDMWVSSLRHLMGSQVQCLAFGGRPKQALCDRLRLGTKPDLNRVMKHLLDLAARGEPADSRIYSYLNEHVDDHRVKGLKGKKCIDIGKGVYLAGSDLYFDAVPFGRYRRHLPESLSEFRGLFEVLGVKARAAITPDELVMLLLEVASEFGSVNKIPDDDAAAVMKSILRLLREAQLRDAGSVQEAATRALDQKCLPRSDGLLARPTELVIRDQSHFAKEFEKALGSHLIDKNPEYWTVLHNAFGVPMLSATVVVELTAREGEVPDRQAMRLLKERERFIRRVIESLRSSTDTGWTLDVYGRLQIARVRKLEAKYTLGLVASRPVGPKAIPAHFDQSTGVLLLGMNVALDKAPFARALADAINPELESSRLVPLLMPIMAATDLDALDQELSDLGVDLLGEAEADSVDVSSKAVQALGETISENNASADHDAAAPVSDADTTSALAEANGTEDTPNSSAQLDEANKWSESADISTQAADESVHDGPAGGDERLDDTHQQPSRRKEEGVDSETEGSDEPRPGQRSGDSPGSGESSGDKRSSNRSPSGLVDVAGHKRGARARQSEGSEGARSPLESAANWLRARVGPGSEDHDEGRDSRDPKRYSDREARAIVVSFEKSRGWDASPASDNQRGYDVLSRNPKTGERRFIEVKGVGATWDDDATIRLTRAQFDDGRGFEGANEDYWLYVVDRLSSDRPRVIAIRNPSRQGAWFYFQAQDWMREAEVVAEVDAPAASREAESAPNTASVPTPKEAPAHIDGDILAVTDSLVHPLLAGLGQLPLPAVQYSVFVESSELGLAELAWPRWRVAVLIQQQRESEGALRGAGWKTTVVEAGANTQVILDWLKSALSA